VRRRPSRRESLLALAVLLALSLAIFGWIPGKTAVLSADMLSAFPPWRAAPEVIQNPLLTDPLWVFYPWALEFRRAILSGRLPLWDPSIRAGVPIAANPISAFFFPLTWIVVPLGAAAGVSLLALLRPTLAAFFAFLYLRRARFSPPASAFGALVYGFSFSFVVWAEHPHGNVLMLLPLLLMAIDGIVVEGGAGRTAALALVIALMAVGGHPESAFHATAFAAVYAAVQILRFRRRPSRAVLSLLAAGVWAGALSLFAVYPFVTVILGSMPYHGEHPAWAVPLRAALGALFPQFMGSPARGVIGTDMRINFNETAMFFGLLSLSLVPAALAGPHRVRNIPSGRFWLVTLICFGFLIFAAPRWSGFPSLPILGKTYNNRLSLLAGLPLGVLAAEGLELLKRSRTLRVWTISLVALAAAVGAAVAACGPGRPDRIDVVWAAAILCLGGLSAVAFRQKHAAAPLLLCAVQGLDLWRAGAGYHPVVALEKIYPPFPSAPLLREQTKDARLLGIGLIFPPNSSTVYGLRDVRGYDAVEDVRFHSVRQRIARWSQNPYMPAVIGFTPESASDLSLFSVRTLVLPPGKRLNEAQASALGLDVTQVYQGSDANIYRVDNSAGRLQQISRIFPVLSKERRDLDPRRAALVEGVPGPMAFASEPAGLHILEDAPERFHIATESAAPFFLRVSDAFDPGWSGWLDGNAVPLYRTDGIFRGVFVPAGRHSLEMRYALPGAPLTIPASAFAFVLLILAARPGRRPPGAAASRP
jgi:hypothetical protein